MAGLSKLCAGDRSINPISDGILVAVLLGPNMRLCLKSWEVQIAFVVGSFLYYLGAKLKSLSQTQARGHAASGTASGAKTRLDVQLCPQPHRTATQRSAAVDGVPLAPCHCIAQLSGGCWVRVRNSWACVCLCAVLRS